MKRELEARAPKSTAQPKDEEAQKQALIQVLPVVLSLKDKKERAVAAAAAAAEKAARAKLQAQIAADRKDVETRALHSSV
jgi:hypothetical protein